MTRPLMRSRIMHPNGLRRHQSEGNMSATGNHQTSAKATHSLILCWTAYCGGRHRTSVRGTCSLPTPVFLERIWSSYVFERYCDGMMIRFGPVALHNHDWECTT